MIIIGIDNGLSGAISVITPDNIYVVPMPVIKSGKTKNVYDEQIVYHTFFNAACSTPDRQGNAHAFIEHAQAMPKQGGTSMFNFGVGYGLIRGMLVALGIPYTVVHPRVWQKVMLAGVNKDNTKAASIIIAKRLFPDVSLRRTEKCRTDSDGMADALLIAAYGQRTLGVE